VIDFGGLGPEVVDERLDILTPSAILGYRDNRNLISETRLQPFERRHLPQTRFAPSGPKVDEDELAGKFGKADGVTGKVDQRNRWRWNWWRAWNKLSEPRPPRLACFVLHRDRAARQRQRQQYRGSTSPFYHFVLPSGRPL